MELKLLQVATYEKEVCNVIKDCIIIYMHEGQIKF